MTQRIRPSWRPFPLRPWVGHRRPRRDTAEPGYVSRYGHPLTDRERAYLFKPNVTPKWRREKRGVTDLTARATFDALLVGELPAMRRQALGLTKDADRAGDIVQATAAKLTERWNYFVPGTNFGAWAATILRNTFLDGLRRAKIRNHDDIDSEIYDPALASAPMQESGIIAREMLAAFSVLSPDHKRTLLASVVHGRTYEEIAHADGISDGTVKSRVHRARAAMQVALDGGTPLIDVASTSPSRLLRFRRRPSQPRQSR